MRARSTGPAAFSGGRASGGRSTRSPAPSSSHSASASRRPSARRAASPSRAPAAELHGTGLEFAHVSPPDRPLTLGELLSEAVRLYSVHPGAALGLGLVEGGAFLLARLTPDLFDVLIIALAFTGIFGAAARLVHGDTFAEAWAQGFVRRPPLP